jgi:hypothetical protein
MAYDSANAVIRRELSTGKRTGVASASVDKFMFFQKAMLRKVHAQVVVAGTNAAAGFDIYVGTTSVGAVTLGTNTAGSVASSSAINAEIPASGHIDIQGKANSATLQASFVIEYDVVHDAVQS